MKQQKQDTEKQALRNRYNRKLDRMATLYPALSVVTSFLVGAGIFYFGCIHPGKGKPVSILRETKESALVQEYIQTENQIKRLDSLASSFDYMSYNTKKISDEFPSFIPVVSAYEDSIKQRREKLVQRNQEREKLPEIQVYKIADKQYGDALLNSIRSGMFSLMGTILGLMGVNIGYMRKYRRKLKQLDETEG